MNLPVGVVAIIGHWTNASVLATTLSLAVVGVIFATVSWRAIRLWQGADLSAMLDRLDLAQRLLLIAGALLICGCFLAG